MSVLNYLPTGYRSKKQSNTESLKELGQILQKQQNKMQNLILEDGKSLGRITSKGLSALQNNEIEQYTPVNDEEKATLENYKEYRNNQVITVPITDTKNIDIKYGNAVKIDDYIDQNGYNGIVTGSKATQFWNGLKELISGLELNEDEKKQAESYAGLRLLAKADTSDGKSSARSEILAPAAKFVQGIQDSVQGVKEFVFDSGFGSDKEYAKKKADEIKFYEENPDQLGLALYNSDLAGYDSNYLTEVRNENLLGWTKDTSPITQAISEYGMRSAGQMLGAYGTAYLAGIPQAMATAGAALRATPAVAAAANSKIGSAATKVLSKTPAIPKVASKGIASSVVNKGIGTINKLSAKNVISFLNPLDNPTTAIMGAGAYQNKYVDLLRAGYDENTAQKNALFTGYVNTITEKMGYDGKPGNFFKKSGNVVSGSVKQSLLKNTGNVLLKTYLPNTISEGIEEVYATVLERFGDYVSEVGYLGEDGEYHERPIAGDEGVLDPKAMGESFLGGLIGGAVMGSVGVISDIANMSIGTAKANHQDIQKATDSIRKHMEETMKKNGIDNISIPEAPDFQKASVREISQYYESMVDCYKKILGDNRVIEHDNKLLNKIGKFYSDSESVDALIESGLESPENTPSRKLAEQLKEKREKNQTITMREIGELQRENAIQIAGEEQALAENSNTGVPSNNQNVADASTTIQKIQKTLIQKGVPDADRQSIIATAHTLENSLAGSNKNVGRVASGVRNITSNITETFAKDVGIVENSWPLFNANLKAVSTADSVIDRDFIKTYADSFAQALQRSNPQTYQKLSVGNHDAGTVLSDYILSGTFPGSVSNVAEIQDIANTFTELVQSAAVKVSAAHAQLYGSNTRMNTQEKSIRKGDFSSVLDTGQTGTMPTNKTGKEAIILTKTGDGYETYGESAKVLVEELGLTPDYKTVQGKQVMHVVFPAARLSQYAKQLGNDNITAFETNGVSHIVLMPEENAQIAENQATTGRRTAESGKERTANIVTLENPSNIYSIFDGAKTITVGKDLVTDGKAAVPKTEPALSAIQSTNAKIEENTVLTLAEVYHKENPVVITGIPKVYEENVMDRSTGENVPVQEYIFEIDGAFYACQQKYLDAFASGDTVIRAGNNATIPWTVHDKSGNLVGIIMPISTGNITQEIFDKLDSVQEVLQERERWSQNNEHAKEAPVDNRANVPYNESRNGGIDNGQQTGIRRSDIGGYRGIPQDGQIQQESTQRGRNSNESGNIEQTFQRGNTGSNQFLSERTVNALRNDEIEPVSMRNAQSGEEFHAAISQAKQTNPHGAYVTAYDAADYGGMKTFLSDNGKTGIAVKPDGDIVSVFNAPDSGHKGATNTLLPLAIENGGNKLDNYDGKLSLLYQKFGFIPVAKVKFDPQYAPDDWNYERDGQPDIIFWVHNGDSADVVAENIGQYPIHDLSQVPYFDSYDEAAAYRDSLIGQQNQAGPNGPASFMPENNSRSFSVDSESGGSIEITAEDVKAVQSIGRKSVNDFTSEDIAKTEGFARKYFQEMGVKSPFFRAWFGDWRAGDTTPIHIVTEPDSTRGVKVNIDTGWNIQVSGKVFNETKAHNSQQNVKARPYLGYINSLVENAVLLDSYTIPESKAKSANSTMMHSFYAIADMGNGRELIKLYVEELNDVNSDGTIKRAYQLQNIIKSSIKTMIEDNQQQLDVIGSESTSLPAPSAIADNQRLSAKGSGSASLAQSSQPLLMQYTVSQLFQLVKQNDTNFNPKPVGKVVNEDGTPKVVYHGTAEEFFAFDKNLRGINTGAQSSKRAFFFTSSRRVAEGYANDARPQNIQALYNKAERLEKQAASNGRYDLAEQAWMDYEKAELGYDGRNYIIGVYIDLKNPFIYDFKGSEYRETTYNDLIKKAIANGNDGVIFENTFDASNITYDEMCDIYAVFEPNQIKSATDNIGTFNRDDVDIRYSMQGGNHDGGQGSLLSDGSNERENGTDTQKQAQTVAGGARSYQEGRKTASERRKYCETLKTAGHTEKKIKYGVEALFISPDGYNAEMKAIVEENRLKGVNTEFITGTATIGFTGGKKARGVFDSASNTIVIQYDHYLYSPQQLNRHEGIHKDYQTGRTQKAKNIILNNISAAEKQTILKKISEDYNGIINGMEEQIFEEFICNTMAGMNEYTARFEQLINDYWDGKEIVDYYSPKDYTESIDAGGRIAEGGNNDESSNAEAVGGKRTSKNNDSIWERSDDSKGIYRRVGNRTHVLRGSQETGHRLINWSRRFANLNVFKSGEKERSYGILRKISRLSVSQTDAINRPITAEVQNFFKNTVVKNTKGELVPVYHATDNNFDIFEQGDFGFHLGSTEQALSFNKKYIKEVYANITNPVFISEDTMHWYGLVVASKLQEQGIISNVEYERLSALDGFFSNDYNSPANKAIRELLKQKGYDGIVYNNGFEGDGISFIAFDPNQIKYTSNQTPTGNEDIRYSLDDDGMYDLMDIWNEKLKEYGAMPKGENPARDVDVPNKIAEDQPVSRFARTMMEAGITPDFAISEFEESILDGTMAHEVVTNEKAREEALKEIQHLGFQEALKKWEILSDSGKVGKKEFALGMELYNQCITNKDTHNAMRIASELAAEATRAGQTLQACRMLKLMNPDGQLYYLEKSIQKMNDEFRSKVGKRYRDIKLDENLMDDFLSADSEEERNKIYDKICQNIADQIPSTLLDKWNSWRYLAMLGNPRTHLRNIIGNAVFVPAIRIKNYIGAVLESTSGVKTEERTKSVKKDKAAVEFAKKDFEKMASVLQGENAKYAITSDIEGKRRIFQNAVLEKLRTKNFEFLENEDMWFLKLHYVDVLARIITARKIDVKELGKDTKKSNQLLADIRAYAIKEAQAATYRDANAIAELMNQWQRSLERSDNKAVRLASVAIEGTMPFKKTPLNIAKQGVMYSPAGILSGIYKAVSKVKRGGTYSTTEIIDTLSKGLSGTGIMLLGFLLAHFGFLAGGDDEDKKKKAFDKLVGEQSYALKVFGKSYTIDWAVPLSLPLFVGAKLSEMTEESGFSFTQVTNALSTLTAPLLELSVLSGISDVIEAARYNETNAIAAVIYDMVSSYFTQAFPTVGGQISRMFDKTKRNYYYYDKNSSLPKFLQNFIGQAASKTPFASYLFEPSIDAWGREETYGNALERVFENAVSPGYYSETDYTNVDNELKELYERTGDSDVFPKIQQKYFTEDKERYNMSASEYTEAKKLRGQKSFELVNTLISSGRYASMSDEDKVSALSKCYTKAGEYVKKEMLPKLKEKKQNS